MTPPLAQASTPRSVLAALQVWAFLACLAGVAVPRLFAGVAGPPRWIDTALTGTALLLGGLLILRNSAALAEPTEAPGPSARWWAHLGWGTGLVLAAIVATSAAAFSYRLGDHDLREDEFQVVDAAAGYLHTGTFYRWRWLEGRSARDVDCVPPSSSCHYTRAWPHSWMIAQAYRVFGVSEWSSRIVSVVFGTLCVLLVYPVAWHFSRARVPALFATLAVGLNPWLVELFRYARMYAVLIPLFLLLCYLVHRGITEANRLPLPAGAFRDWLERHLDFNYALLLPAALLLGLAAIIHVNALIILPILLTWCLVFAVLRRERRHVIASAIGFAGLAAVVLADLAGVGPRVLRYVGLREQQNLEYLGLMLGHPLSSRGTLILLVLGTALVLAYPGRAQSGLAALYAAVGVSLGFFVWVADRYVHVAYISHLLPLAIILAVALYCRLVGSFPGRATRLAGYGMLVVLIAGSFSQEAGRLYTSKHDYGRFREAYQEIRERIEPEREVIFGQYLRTYYLQELAGRGVRRIGMSHSGRYSLDRFLADLEGVEAGWVTWETRKAGHLVPELREYISHHFQKLHGEGVDGLGVEVYYFERQRGPDNGWDRSGG